MYYELNRLTCHHHPRGIHIVHTSEIPTWSLQERKDQDGWWNIRTEIYQKQIQPNRIGKNWTCPEIEILLQKIDAVV